MKYLSKHYRPAEKEFLKLAEGFNNLIKMEEAAKRELHPDVYKFQEVMVDMMERVETYVGDRIKTEEEREAEEALKRANATSDCPQCDAIVPVTIIGEIKLPKTGYTHNIVKCKVCNKQFTEELPNNDLDILKFQENLVTQLKKIEPDGRTRWQRFEMTEADMARGEEAYRGMKESMDAEKAAMEETAKAEAELDKIVEQLRDELLLIRMKQQQWNGGDAKA